MLQALFHTYTGGYVCYVLLCVLITLLVITDLLFLFTRISLYVYTNSIWIVMSKLCTHIRKNLENCFLSLVDNALLIRAGPGTKAHAIFYLPRHHYGKATKPARYEIIHVPLSPSLSIVSSKIPRATVIIRRKEKKSRDYHYSIRAFPHLAIWSTIRSTIKLIEFIAK